MAVRMVETEALIHVPEMDVAADRLLAIAMELKQANKRLTKRMNEIAKEEERSWQYSELREKGLY